jgi:lactoylglutathione lyase
VPFGAPRSQSGLGCIFPGLHPILYCPAGLTCRYLPKRAGTSYTDRLMKTIPAGTADKTMKARWTHLALHVRNLQASIAFYERFTNLRVIDRHSDASSTGMEVVWLSDRPASDESAFMLVLQEGTPHSIPGAKPQSPLGPISHFGFALPSREAVDAVATEGENARLLQFGPTFLNPYAGYLCIIRDPDGHNVEFSHGQALGKPLDHTDAANIAR